MGESILQAASNAQLLQLGLLHHEHMHKELTLKHASLTKQYLAVKEMLEKKISGGEECEDDRAMVIKLETEIKATKDALDQCLATKKELNAKIDAANDARKAAEKELASSNFFTRKTKQLLDDCLYLLKKERKKLQECLDR